MIKTIGSPSHLVSVIASIFVRDLVRRSRDTRDFVGAGNDFDSVQIVGERRDLCPDSFGCCFFRGQLQAAADFGEGGESITGPRALHLMSYNLDSAVVIFLQCRAE